MTIYTDTAPILSGVGITKTQANTYFENKIKVSAPAPDPKITKKACVAIADALYVDGIEASGGIVGLSQSVKLKVAQVKSIIAEIGALEGLWNASNTASEPEELLAETKAKK